MTELIAIVGPTATGKSDLALDLAQRLDAEIVNADAAQLYRGMDIGTAKVPPAERRGIPHHQLDVLSVREEASVAAYQRHARADVEAIQARGRAVIVVGGSGLYLRGLLDEMEFPGTDPVVRAAIEARAVHEGAASLYAELTARDPVAASRIEPANTRRIVRALEVIELTGEPFSARLPEPRYWRPAVQLGLDCAGDVLDARIDARVDGMLAAGLVAEVEGLIAEGLREGRTASRAVGYRQILDHLDGRLTLAEARDAIALATRQLARRQRKWFRRDERIVWLEAGGREGAAESSLADSAVAVIRRAGAGG